MTFDNAHKIDIHSDTDEVIGSLYHRDFKYLKTDVVEEKYNAKYIGEFTVKRRDGWANIPVQIYYNEEKHPEGSNYLGVFQNPETQQVLLTDGLTATEPFVIVLVPNDKDALIAIYSAFRHDYQSFVGNIADGGRDYVRTNLGANTAKAYIKNGKVYLDGTF